MDESPTGGLEKTTEPASGSTVAPGETVEVTLSWDATERHHDELHKAIDCVVVDGAVDPELSIEERPTANDGLFEAEYVLPDLPDGTALCDFAFLSDDAHGHGYARSETVCFTITADGAEADQPRGVPAPPAAVTPGPPPSAPPPSASRAAPPPPAAAPALTSAPAAAPSPAATPEVMGEVLEATELPRTGPSQAGLLLAGAALALGGLALAASPAGRR